MAPVIHITPVGNLGNQMFQLMLARALAARIPGLQISGYNMPLWKLVSKDEPADAPAPVLLRGQWLDFELLANLMKRGWLTRVNMAALGFRMEHCLPLEDCRALFPATGESAIALSDDEILINIRAAEILSDVHEDYGPLPLAYYQQLIRNSGLRPVFMGQIGDDPYSLALRRAFPEARFEASRGVLADFNIIRQAKHIVVSVSTFSWLAAWMSNARTIYLPLCGILNPLQRPDINLLPLDDGRYRFHHFPIRHWKADSQQFSALFEAHSVFPALEPEELRLRLQTAGRGISAKILRYRIRLLYRALAQKLWNKGGSVILR